MSNNQLYEGDVHETVASALTHPANGTYPTSGDPVLLTGKALVGVALNSAAAAGDRVAVALEGVWTLPASGVTASALSAVAAGDKLYFADADVKAAGTITSDATAPSDGDTVVIGDITYTFKTALTTDPATVPYEVLIGISAAVALDNLKSAINATAGAGTVYGEGTEVHPEVTATTNTNTTQVVEALVAGTPGNAIATTETSSHLSWGATTLVAGCSKGDLVKNTAKTAFGVALDAVGAGETDTIRVLIKKVM